MRMDMHASKQTRTAVAVAAARTRRKATRIGFVDAPPAIQRGSEAGIGDYLRDGAEAAEMGSKLAFALAPPAQEEVTVAAATRGSSLQPTAPPEPPRAQVEDSSLTLHATGRRVGGERPVAGGGAWECGDAGRTAGSRKSVGGAGVGGEYEERKGDQAVLLAVGEECEGEGLGGGLRAEAEEDGVKGRSRPCSTAARADACSSEANVRHANTSEANARPANTSAANRGAPWHR